MPSASSEKGTYTTYFLHVQASDGYEVRVPLDMDDATSANHFLTTLHTAMRAHESDTLSLPELQRMVDQVQQRDLSPA